MRLVFAGTPDFARVALQALRAAGHEIVLVLTQPDRPAGRGLKLTPSPVKQAALDAGIEVAQPRSLRLDGRYPDEAASARALLERAAPDAMVVAAYGLILPAWTLQLPRLGCLNIHASLLPRLGDIDRSELRKIVVIGGEQTSIEGLDVLPSSALDSTSEDAPTLDHPIAPWDTQTIIYTSGTTGPSKGVLSSYAHLYATGRGISADRDGIPYLNATDTFMVNLPLFHVGGTGPSYAMLINGGSIALVDRFDTGSFWSTVAKTGTTMVILLGVMASFLMKRTDTGDEKDSPLKNVTVIPLSEEGIAFGKRYGVTTHTLFNMSEVSCPLATEPNPTVAAACGKPRAGVEARLVDAHDCEVAAGEIGELILRTDSPWAMNHGYNKAPEATALAWRNGWFHTGDAFRVDQDGNYFFVDRFKDAIRRRGENISSFEVELEVAAHPAVREAAAVSVPSEHGEDDVLVVVSLVEGQKLDPADLIHFLKPRMAHFMVPRYIRILGDLPKTPTNKVEKYLLRKDGVTSDTFDRDAAGIRIKIEPV